VAQRTQQVDDYLKKQDPKRQAALEQVRSLILESAPDITETITYRMPTYVLNSPVCAFASQKHYMSLYMDTSLVAKYRGELAGLDCGKGCIRFRKIEDLPLATIRKILLETIQSREAA
jgi:uncharacterized protein YdhG (YjbR/CyaY superfamily)